MSPLEEKFASEGLEICMRRSAGAMDRILHLLDQCELLPQRTEDESRLRFIIEAGLLQLYAELGRIHFAAERGRTAVS